MAVLLYKRLAERIGRHALSASTGQTTREEGGIDTAINFGVTIPVAAEVEYTNPAR